MVFFFFLNHCSQHNKKLPIMAVATWISPVSESLLLYSANLSVLNCTPVVSRFSRVEARPLVLYIFIVLSSTLVTLNDAL